MITVPLRLSAPETSYTCGYLLLTHLIALDKDSNFEVVIGSPLLQDGIIA
jgi:hypothetical protein